MSDYESANAADNGTSKIKLDDDFLRGVGLERLPLDDRRELLRAVYKELELRVGTVLARAMTNEQLADFETYIEAKDEAGAFNWLQLKFPSYGQIVREVFSQMQKELVEAAPMLLLELCEAES